MGVEIEVRLAEIRVIDCPDDFLVAHGLGSCICICAYDPSIRLAAMAHVVLPESHDESGSAGKCADTAVPALVEALEKRGGSADLVRIAISGGADISSIIGNGVKLEMGRRNSEAVKRALVELRMSVVASELGGTSARSVYFGGDGQVRVMVVGEEERVLVNLAN